MTDLSIEFCGVKAPNPFWLASGGRLASTCSTGRVRTPSRRSVPGVLPESPVSLAMSSTSSASWNAVPMRHPNWVRTSVVGSPAPAIIAPRRAETAISAPVLPATTSR